MSLRVFSYPSKRAEARLQVLRSRGGGTASLSIERSARKIVERIRRGGDGALLAAVAEFDGVDAASVVELKCDPAAQHWPVLALRPVGDYGGGDSVSAELCTAIEIAIARVERFHRAQLESTLGSTARFELDGVTVEEVSTPIRRVGLYVPGGRFPYPSTAIMSVVPAQIAGVEEIVVVTPPTAITRSRVLRYVLERLAVHEVWAMGGAHAVAALAYGTPSLFPVDLIAGPGNQWVSAAKRIVRHHVGVDREAGPSEVVIVASAEAPAELVAADLLAQAEHDPAAMSVLVTTSRKLARRVNQELERLLTTLPEPEVALSALRSLGTAFVVSDVSTAVVLADQLAPEHLQLIGHQVEALAPCFRAAGAVFLGAQTPTVFGDYVAGPSHVLPTGGAARFSSGLATGDFQRRFHSVRCAPAAASRLAPVAAALAEVEGLVAHRHSAMLRAPATAGADEQESATAQRVVSSGGEQA